MEYQHLDIASGPAPMPIVEIFNSFVIIAAPRENEFQDYSKRASFLEQFASSIRRLPARRAALDAISAHLVNRLRR
jgi:hypothetical protein